MKVEEVMVNNVISVNRNSSIEEIVEVLTKNRISGIPV